MTEVAKRLRVPAQADSLQQLRTLVRECAEATGFHQDGVEQLVLAVNEACMNVIQHGYRGQPGSIELHIVPIVDGLEFRVHDSAQPVSLDDWRPRALDDLRPGGLGVHFIREIMDDIEYVPVVDGVGNSLSMKKYLRDGMTSA